MIKKDHYFKLLKRLESQISDERDWLANLSNVSQLLGILLKDVNWVGFYLNRGNELVLGPFWGNPAVTRIAFGKGVCGTAVERKETIVVPDVHAFPGHIVCDIVSQSEIVVPLYLEGKLLGVLDIDSPVLARFDHEDQIGLEMLMKTLIEQTEWETFWKI